MKSIKQMIAVSGMLFSLSISASPVNINQADAKTIAKSLNGIGISKAEAIVDYRQENGPFKSVKDLAKVRGLGLKIVDRNREDILIK